MARNRTARQRRARQIKRLWAHAYKCRSSELAFRIIDEFGGGCPVWARDGVDAITERLKRATEHYERNPPPFAGDGPDVLGI